MRAARSDMFGCASHGENFQLHQKLPSWWPKKTGQVLVRTLRDPSVRKAP
jgi:hypothetical protein